MTFELLLLILGAIGTVLLGIIGKGVYSLVAAVIESSKQIAILSAAVKEIRDDIAIIYERLDNR